MKKAYVICDNHMDPIWRRCFENHFTYRNTVVRSYAQIEEALFDSWIDIVENSDCKYSVEQSLTIKKYFESNPDKFERIKALVLSGKIELLGSGETIIDYNMVNGEAIVRDHMYSIGWYMDNFGVRPGVGCATDTFGLSAQIPQILNQFGYNNLVIYSRVFKDAKPFWRGLDGTVIYIKTDYAEAPRVQCPDFKKYRACPVCEGEGCPVCNHTGIDYSYRTGIDICDKLSSPSTSLISCFEKMRDSEVNEFMFQITSEEAREIPEFIAVLEGYSKQFEISLEYLTYGEFMIKFGQEALDLLEKGNVPEELIDERVEGNVVSTGCYVTRNKLKKQNRELEDLLLSSEKLATFAIEYGMDYPARKIERLWNHMALLQFHDSITASHIDAGYDELMTLVRNIRLGAAKIYYEAMSIIENTITVKAKEGCKAFVLFNPLSWQVSGIPQTAYINIGRDEDIKSIDIWDVNGNSLKVTDLEQIVNEFSKTLKVGFLGATLPPMGFSVFYYKPSETTKCLSTADNFIENEYYSVAFDKKGVKAIFDKELGVEILGANTGALVAQEDYGSPWETLATPYFKEYIHDNSNASVEAVISSEVRSITIKGNYINPRRKIDKLDWTQTITLYSGVKKIYFHIDVDWNTENTRLMVAFPLTYKTPSDEAFYEIPYGTLKRPSYKPEYGVHSAGNGDWPSNNFVAAYNGEKDFTVTLMNRGLYANQLQDGVFFVSILRSPQIPVYIFDFEGARDKGVHSFDMAVTSSKGTFEASRSVQSGMEFNTAFLCTPAIEKEGCLASSHSFVHNENSDIIISSVKRAEKSDDVIIRMYEPYGKGGTDILSGVKGNPVCSNFMEKDGDVLDKIEFRPYEIKTIKFKKQ